MLAARSSRLPAFTMICMFAVITVFVYHRNSITPHLTSFRPASSLNAANATLGFGGLFVVSGPDSPRRAKLEQAAAVTELELTIPELQRWTDEDIKNFRWHDESESNIRSGSVLAWLSHRVVLKEFLESGLETALIFEDDVDWDIRLRTQQIPLAQQAVRTLSGTTTLNAKQYPWGVPSQDWDLLYVGNCGDYFGDIELGVGVGHNHPDQLARIPHVLFPDPTMLLNTDLHPFTASLLTAFNVPEQTRVVHKSQWPLCTFGYAITRDTAHRILSEIAPPKEDIARKLQAYDAAILSGCRDGPLNHCYTVTPELFHHMEGDSIIAGIEASERIIFRTPVDYAGLEQVRYRQETSNIGCGFWSGEFYYDDDTAKLALLREDVGRKGRCLKNGGGLPPSKEQRQGRSW